MSITGHADVGLTRSLRGMSLPDIPAHTAGATGVIVTGCLVT